MGYFGYSIFDVQVAFGYAFGVGIGFGFLLSVLRFILFSSLERGTY